MKLIDSDQDCEANGVIAVVVGGWLNPTRLQLLLLLLCSFDIHAMTSRLACANSHICTYCCYLMDKMWKKLCFLTTKTTWVVVRCAALSVSTIKTWQRPRSALEMNWYKGFGMNTFKFVIKLLLLHLFMTYILVKKLYLGAVGWVELVERSAKKVTVIQVTRNTTFGTRYHINSTTK